ncbi:Serine/threonine-protein phosphatase 2A activator 1 [Lambiella insularis]|nr:Serine/threonine-protein phosphatase 2A activator 1 [Lambiella insularis]
MSSSSTACIERLDQATPHIFMLPVKKINTGQDVSTFLVSKAYRDLTEFLVQLNRSMFPLVDEHAQQWKPQVFELGTPLVRFSDTVLQLRRLLANLGQIIEEIPLDPGPRRFGNVSFRKWHEAVDLQAQALLQQYLPPQVCAFAHTSDIDPITELRAYFLGSFGSSQRLDYGTGHELSFLAFLACVWKLGGFPDGTGGDVERQIILGVLDPYLILVRRLITTYNLEPAGSHGVWGLDDHSFLPYIFGSAQNGPPMKNTECPPAEGSLLGAPDPGIVTNAHQVEKERRTNFYFGAIGFIYDVKKGPFWEHSPTLYDISGVRSGWAKINKGMMRMYNAEVLSKFPVVQHFPFGSLLSWERDSKAIEPPPSVHSTCQPSRDSVAPVSVNSASMRHPVQEGTQAPWASLRAGRSEAIDGSQLLPASGQPHESRIVPKVAQYSSIMPGSVGHAAEQRRIGSTAHDPARRAMHLVRNAAANADAHVASMPPPTKAPWAK